jgi:hypothetical protein
MFQKFQTSFSFFTLSSPSCPSSTFLAGILSYFPKIEIPGICHLAVERRSMRAMRGRRA